MNPNLSENKAHILKQVDVFMSLFVVDHDELKCDLSEILVLFMFI